MKALQRHDEGITKAWWRHYSY